MASFIFFFSLGMVGILIVLLISAAKYIVGIGEHPAYHLTRKEEIEYMYRHDLAGWIAEWEASRGRPIRRERGKKNAAKLF